MAVRLRRMGQFEISDFLMASVDKRGLRRLTATLVPYRVEHRFDRQTFHYIAESELFDEIEEGELPPWYEIEITECEAGRFDFKAIRCAHSKF